jgi:hypothetical protein
MACAKLNVVGFIVLLAGLTAACSKLGIGERPANDGAPDEAQLQKISYMSADNTGPKGRKLYTHLEQARSCADLELAMRWNRPPNLEGGPFHKKLHYVTQQFPPDLPKETEVFVTARIERGQMLPGGGAGWLLHMQDGPLIQAVESTNFWEKQEQESQAGQPAAVVQPTRPGRTFCGHGVYQGQLGKDPERNAQIPLVSMLFSMDRDG